MLIHFRESFADLNQAELQLANLRLSDYLEPTTSYLSIIELGLYDSTLKIYKELTDQGIEPHSDQWKAEIECKLEPAQGSDAAAAVSRRFRRTAMPAFIRWTAAAGKTRTGTNCRSKSAPAR